MAKTKVRLLTVGGKVRVSSWKLGQKSPDTIVVDIGMRACSGAGRLLCKRWMLLLMRFESARSYTAESASTPHRSAVQLAAMHGRHGFAAQCPTVRTMHLARANLHPVQCCHWQLPRVYLAERVICWLTRNICMYRGSTRASPPTHAAITRSP